MVPSENPPAPGEEFRRAPRFPTALAAPGAIFAVALILRAVELADLSELPLFDHPVMDEQYHDIWAREVAAGELGTHPVFFRAPLYPFLLGLLHAVTGGSLAVARAVQAVLGALSCAMVAGLAGRISPSRLAGPAAGLLAATSWTFIHFDTQLLVEPLFIFLVLGALHLTLAARKEPTPVRLTLAGLAYGLAAVARPTILPFVPVALAWLLLPGGRRWIRSALFFVMGVGVAILPVTLHNLVRGGDLVLVASQGGVNFYIGNNPEADGATAIVPGTRPTWQGGYLDSIRIAEAAEGRALKPSEVSRYWYGRALSFMTDSPGQAISLLWRKTVLFWNAFEIGNNEDFSDLRSRLRLIGLPLPSFGFLAPLGMAGLLLAFAGRRGSQVGFFARSPAAFLLAAFIAVTSLATIAFFVNTRYRLPTQMILAVFAGVALADWMGSARSGPPREGSHSRTALVASVAVALALFPLMGVNHLGLRENPAIGMHLMGIAWGESGNDAEALREFHRAAGQSGNPLAHASLTEAARILMAAGREAEALADLRRAIRLAPADADARSAMAEILFSRGDLDGARLHLEAALAGSIAAGNDPDLHYRLGLVVQMQGRIDQAMRAYRAALRIVPSHPEANTNLGLLLSDAGEVREALRHLQRAVAEAPDLAPTRYALAVTLLRAGDRQGAREQARIARSLGARLDPAFEKALQGR